MNEVISGLIQYIDVFIEILFYQYYFNEKKIRNKDMMFYKMGYVALYIMTLFFSFLFYDNMLYILVNLILATIIGYAIYEDNLKNFIASILLCRCIHMACEMVVLSFIIGWLGGHSFEEYSKRSDIYILILIMSKIFIFYMIYILKKIKKENYQITTISDFLFIIIPTSSNLFLLFILMQNVQLQFHLGKMSIQILFTLSLILLVSTLCTFIFSAYYLKMKEKELNYEKAKYYIQYKNEYYEKKNEMDYEVRRMYHDMKQHLMYLQNIGNQKEESKNYIHNIMNKIKDYENYIDTGNDILNTILNEKIKIAEDNNIRMECSIDFKEGDFIRPIDISIIFGNALDNCIEACTEIENIHRRFIIVKSKLENNFICIKFINSKIGISVFEKNIIQTKKENKFYHGFGIANIQEAVLNYDGYCTIEEEDEIFIIKIIIPVCNY